jgi:hypothetical protein
VEGGDPSNRDTNVLVPTEAKKPQETPKILEQVYLWRHLPSIGKS